VIRAVLDTNVLASGFIGERKNDSAPGAPIRYWRAKMYVLVTSDHILSELRLTFDSPYFTNRLSVAEIEEALASLQVDSVMQPITVPVIGIASHPEDDAVLATAISAQANFLVTGDRRLRERRSYRGTLLLSPREFLEVLEAQTPV
jgi:putative PIN family toxin of toxin-antitoxin system